MLVVKSSLLIRVGDGGGRLCDAAVWKVVVVMMEVLGDGYWLVMLDVVQVVLV